MKKYYSRLVLLLTSMTLLNNSFGQNAVYNSGWTTPINITTNGQTMNFTFTNMEPSALTDGKLVIRFAGDFGDYNEDFSVFNNNNEILTTYSNNMECGDVDSLSLDIPLSHLLENIADGELTFKIVTSINVDYFCPQNFFQTRFEYEYCSHNLGAITINASNSVFCVLDEPIALTATPAGGTFSVNGQTITEFNPSNYAPNSNVNVFYSIPTATCTAMASKRFTIKKGAAVNDFVICPGEELTLPNAPGITWFNDQALTSPIDSNQILNSSTTYYYAKPMNSHSFAVNNVDETIIQIIDHEQESGDDRGLLAITPDYVYVVGDNNTARFNASDLSNPVSLPIRDGIISDYKTGKLYTLWSNDHANFDYDLFPYNGAPMTLHGIKEMNEDLEIIGDLLPFSQPIPHYYYNGAGALLTGHGEFGIFSSESAKLYIVDFTSLEVQTMNFPNSDLNIYYNENWISSGAIENVAGEYSMIVNHQGSLVKFNVTTGAPSDTLSQLMDVDFSNFVFSPWHNRIYVHNENYQVNSEALFFMEATVTVQENDNIFADACVNDAVAIVNYVNLGDDVIACENHLPYMIFAGNGYESYTWNGVQNDYNVYAAMQPGTYDVSVVDTYGCTLNDTIVVSIEPCLNINVVSEDAISIFPNPAANEITVALNANIVGGQLSLTDLNGKVFNTSTLTEAAQTINVSDLQAGVYLITVTNANETSTKRFVKL